MGHEQHQSKAHPDSSRFMTWYLNPMASRPMAGMGRLGRLLSGGGILGAGFGVTIDSARLTCGSATSAGAPLRLIAIHLPTEMEVFRASR